MSWMQNQELPPTATNMAQQPNGKEPTYSIRLTPQEFMQFIQERLPTPIDYHSEIALRNLLEAHLADLRIVRIKKGTAPWLKDETPSPPSSPKRHPATSSKPPPGFKVSKGMKRVSIQGCTSYVTSTAASTLSTTSSFGSTSPRVTKPIHKKGGYFKGKKLGFVNGLNHNRSCSPNGPPMAVDQSFSFHHTHPLFRFLYPNDPRVGPLQLIEWSDTSDNGSNSSGVSSRIPALLPVSGNGTKSNEPNKISTPKGVVVKIEGDNVKLEEADSDDERIKVKVEEVETDDEADVKTTITTPEGFVEKIDGGKIHWEDVDSDDGRVKVKVETDDEADDIMTVLATPKGFVEKVDGDKVYWEEVDSDGEADDAKTSLATPKGFVEKVDGGKVYWEEVDSDDEQTKVKVEEVETDNEADVKTTVGEGPTDARKYGISSAHARGISTSKFASGSITATASVAPMSSSTRNGTPVKTSQAPLSQVHDNLSTVYVAPASRKYGAEPLSSAFRGYSSEPSSQTSRKRARDDDEEAVYMSADKRPVKAAKLT